MSARIKVKKGGLPGYHLRDSKDDRRKVLLHLLESNKVSYATLIRRLNVLAIYNKNNHPNMSDKVRRDMAYIRRQQKGGTPAQSVQEFVEKMEQRKARPKGSPLKYQIDYYDMDEEGRALFRKIENLHQKTQLFDQYIQQTQQQFRNYMQRVTPNSYEIPREMWNTIEKQKDKLWSLETILGKFKRDLNDYVLFKND